MSCLPPTWKATPLRAVAEHTVSNVDKLAADDELPVRLCNYTDVYNNEFITLNLPFMPGTATQMSCVRLIPHPCVQNNSPPLSAFECYCVFTSLAIALG